MKTKPFTVAGEKWIQTEVHARDLNSAVRAFEKQNPGFKATLIITDQEEDVQVAGKCDRCKKPLFGHSGFEEVDLVFICHDCIAGARINLLNTLTDGGQPTMDRAVPSLIPKPSAKI